MTLYCPKCHSILRPITRTIYRCPICGRMYDSGTAHVHEYAYFRSFNPNKIVENLSRGYICRGYASSTCERDLIPTLKTLGILDNHRRQTPAAKQIIDAYKHKGLQEAVKIVLYLVEAYILQAETGLARAGIKSLKEAVAMLSRRKRCIA